MKILINARRVLLEKCPRAVFEMPSGPGATLRARCLMIFLTSPVETDWIGGFIDVVRVCIEFATSLLVAWFPSGQLNFVARLVAKSSDLPGKSKTCPRWLFRRRFGGVLLISDLLILKIFVSPGFSSARKEPHADSL